MIKEVFTWWNSQTIGTRISTFFYGYFINFDEYQNKFYTNKDDTKRWVVYQNEVEATKVSPEWNNWLRYTSKEPPSKYAKKYNWQLKHTPNQTGTKKAYSPSSSSFNKKKDKNDLEYEKWNPGN